MAGDSGPAARTPGRGSAFRPRRSLGQNFLVDPAARARLLAALRPRAADRIVEIGPGQGEITLELGRLAATVQAVELEPYLAQRTRERCRGLSNVTVFEGDALTLDLEPLAEGKPGSLRIFGNLPYATATPILRHLLRQSRWILDLTVLVQREVAERIAAQPATREYGYLSVVIQLRASVEALLDIGPRSFRPRPQVASRLLRLRPLPAPPAWPAALEALLEAAFGYRRKQLLGALKHHPAFRDRADLAATLTQAEVDPTVRGETLSPTEFLELARKLS